MESGDDHDHQNAENSGDDQQQVVTSSQVVVAKSYECTFCKRGFSNAQALGGHMNIHRKDKAKLKQVSTNIVETKQQQQQQQRFPNDLEFPKSTMPPSSYSPLILPKINHHHPSSISPSFEADHYHMSTSAPTVEGSSISWPAEWFLKDKKAEISHNTIIDRVVQQQQQQQLALFSQAPSPDEGRQQQLQVESPEDSNSDLDLELRLGGPEPQDPSAKSTTRKFF